MGAPSAVQGRCAHSSLPGCLPSRALQARLASSASSLCGCSHGSLAAAHGARKRQRCSLQVQAIADERTQTDALEEALRASSLTDSVGMDAAQVERQKLQQLLNRWGFVPCLASRLLAEVRLCWLALRYFGIAENVCACVCFRVC